MTVDRLQQLSRASSHDTVLEVEVLRETIYQGWPENKSEVPDSIHAYYDFRGQLTVQDKLVFKGDHLIIPAAMRREMTEIASATYIGIEGEPGIDVLAPRGYRAEGIHFQM